MIKVIQAKKIWSTNCYYNHSCHFCPSGLGSDNIDVDFLFGGQLNLTRYYKNDWHGLYYRKSSGDSLLVAGLDCRHPRDILDEIFSHLRSEGFRKN